MATPMSTSLVLLLLVVERCSQDDKMRKLIKIDLSTKDKKCTIVALARMPCLVDAGLTCIDWSAIGPIVPLIAIMDSTLYTQQLDMLAKASHCKAVLSDGAQVAALGAEDLGAVGPRTTPPCSCITNIHTQSQ